VLNEQHRAEAGVLMDSLLQEMRGVLTDEQLETFEEHLKRRLNRGRFGPKP
jgi:Spy/CpxP family protein refolding chaperone